MLDVRSSSSKNPSTECIMEGLEICLLNNNSRFANIHLLQANGTATGAPNSFSVFDIAISHLNKIINKKRATQFQEYFYFGRYHDNYLIIWCGDTEKINNFHKMLNNVYEKLKFTIEIAGSSICFLDLKIFIQSNRLETTVYSKHTDSHLNLEESCHNKCSKNGIIKSLSLCLHRICSVMEYFKIKSSDYMAYLVTRGHSAFDKVSSIPRYEARKKVEKSFENKIMFSQLSIH